LAAVLAAEAAAEIATVGECGVQEEPIEAAVAVGFAAGIVAFILTAIASVGKC